MQRRKEITVLTPGPARQPKALKPFVAVDFENNLWRLCHRDNRDAILVTYGHIAYYARVLTARLSQDERYWALDKRRIHRFRDGRSMEIHLRTMRDGAGVIGGWIRLQNAKGISVKIHDVKSFFTKTWREVVRTYGTDDLAAIMERTRASLEAVGIRPFRQNWALLSSVPDFVWKHHEINLAAVPAVSALKGPGNLQGYSVFGHTDYPVYSYDINSAYLSVMAEFPSLQPFTDHIWSARRELRQASDPAEFILKIAATIMPGKFSSELPDNDYYRPVLGNYIRQRVNTRLMKAMNLANACEAPTRKNVYRWCVDGFIAYSDVSHLMDTGDSLGQWKPVKKHNKLTIWRTNTWWTDREVKTGGYKVTERQVLDTLVADQAYFPVHASRTIFDWDRLEEYPQAVTLNQECHGDILTACNKCWEGTGDLHDR